MSLALPSVKLGEVLAQVQDEHVVLADTLYPNIGIYSFGRGIFEKPPINGGKSSARTLYRVHAGQFIYSRLFAFEGGYGLVPSEFDRCFVSNEFPTFEVDRSRLCAQYLALHFKLPSTWEALAARTVGMGHRRQRIKPEHLLTYEIPLPPLEEQRRIVAKVEHLASRVEEARGLRDDSKSALAAFAKSSLATVAETVPSDRWRALGEIAEVGGGGTPSKDNPAFWGGEVPWISPKDMKQRRIRDATDHITQTALDNSATRLYNPGCVLIIIRGMILAHTVPVAVLDVNAAINQGIKAVRPCADLDPEYLCAMLWALNGDLLALIGRSSHDTRKLDTEKLLAFRVPVPTRSEQRRILAYLGGLQANIDRMKALQAQTQAELDALLPSILDRAFEGEL